MYVVRIYVALIGLRLGSLGAEERHNVFKKKKNGCKKKTLKWQIPQTIEKVLCTYSAGDIFFFPPPHVACLRYFDRRHG